MFIVNNHIDYKYKDYIYCEMVMLKCCYGCRFIVPQCCCVLWPYNTSVLVFHCILFYFTVVLFFCSVFFFLCCCIVWCDCELTIPDIVLCHGAGALYCLTLQYKFLCVALHHNTILLDCSFAVWYCTIVLFLVNSTSDVLTHSNYCTFLYANFSEYNPWRSGKKNVHCKETQIINRHKRNCSYDRKQE